MKKTLLIVGGILLLALLGVIIYFGFVQQSAIQPISDAGEEALASGINFVTIVDGNSLTGERKLICGTPAPYIFSISNGYSDENPSHPRRAPNNNPLILWADKGDGGDCINYINVQGTFPKGTLEVTCNLKSYSSDPKPAYAYCSVNSITKTASASQSTVSEVKTEKIILNTDNTNVKIESKVDVSSLSYSLSEVTIKFIPPISDPTDSTPDSNSILSILKSWISDLFLALKGLFTSQSIIGLPNPLPGTIEKYTISSSAPIPDSDCNDGSCQLQKANWMFLDSSQNLLKEGTWEKINGVYNKEVFLTIPQNLDKHALIDVIYQYNKTYDFTTNTWKVTSEGVIFKEGYNIKTGLPVPIEETPSTNIVLNILKSIIDFFRNLFGG